MLLRFIPEFVCAAVCSNRQMLNKKMPFRAQFDGRVEVYLNKKTTVWL